jgi:tetratricopeptide (TPR) repeat protein
MADRFTTVMQRGQALLADANFPAAMGEFSTALRYNPQSPDAHYSYAFAAAEDIGEAFDDELIARGIALGRMHTVWREALKPARHVQLLREVRRLYGWKGVLNYKLAVARARQQIAARCIPHLRRAIEKQPRHDLARVLLAALQPLADTSPFSTVLTLLR